MAITKRAKIFFLASLFNLSNPLYQGEATEWTPYNAELNMQSIKVADRKYKRMSNTEYHVKCKGDGKEPHAREGVEG